MVRDHGGREDATEQHPAVSVSGFILERFRDAVFLFITVYTYSIIKSTCQRKHCCIKILIPYRQKGNRLQYFCICIQKDILMIYHRTYLSLQLVSRVFKENECVVKYIYNNQGTILDEQFNYIGEQFNAPKTEGRIGTFTFFQENDLKFLLKLFSSLLQSS